MDDAVRASYLDSLEAAYMSVTVPLVSGDALFPLDAIFQPLRLRHDPLAADDLAEERRRKLLRSADDGSTPSMRGANATEEANVASPVIASDGADALGKSPAGRLVILGGPGAGKTTTLKRLLVDAIQRARATADAPTPIFVALPDLTRSGEPLEEYLAHLALTLGMSPDEATSLWQAIQSGQAFIYLDSLDEVAPAQRGALISQINDLAREPGNTWVIGSRFTEYKGGQFAHARFAEWELQPLGHEQRVELARRILPALSKRLYAERADAPRLSPVAFVAALEASPQANMWQESPLLVSLAAVVFARRGALPQSRALLYRAASEAILTAREPDAARREELLAALTEVALRLFTRAGRVFTRADLLATLMTLQQDQQAAWSPDDLAQRIITSGALDVIASSTETIYAFFHQSFQEYLAAVALASRLTSLDEAQRATAWEFAWGKRLYSRWTEILRLLAPTLAQEDDAAGLALAIRWLRALMGLREAPDGDVGDLGFSLAIATLAEGEALPDAPMPDAEVWRRLRFEAFRGWVDMMSEAIHMRRYPRQRRLMAMSDDIGRIVTQLERDESAPHDADIQHLIEPLILLLTSRDQFIPKSAMEALLPFGSHAPLATMVAVARSEKRNRGEFMWMEKTSLLGRLDHPGIHQALEELFGSQDDGDQVVAVVALGNRGNLLRPDDVARIIGALNDPSLYVRMRAIRVLGDSGAFLSSAETATAIDALVELTLNPTNGANETQEEDRWARDDEARVTLRAEQAAKIVTLALKALTQLNPASLTRIPQDSFIAMLNSPHKRIRYQAVQILSQFGERAPLDLIAATLCTEEWAMEKGDGILPHFPQPVANGARELGQLGERMPIEPMIRLLRHDNDAVRSYALKALEEAKGRAPLELIHDAIQSPHPEIRQGGIGLLARSKHKGSLPIIRVALTEPKGGDASEQSQSYSSHQRSNRLQPPNGIEWLTIPSGVTTLLRPQRYDLAGWAEIATHQLETRSEWLCEAAFGVLEASEGFATPEGVATLEALLSDPIRKLRPRALAALGDAGALAPVDTLLDALARTTSETIWQGAAAIKALGALGTEQAIAALSPIASCAPDDPMADLRPNALEALGRACPHPTPEIAAIEIDGMRSDDNDVSCAATGAIKHWQSIPALSDDDLLVLTMRALNVDVVYEDEDTAEYMSEMYERLLAAAESGPHISLLNDVAIHDPDERRRSAAISCLGRMNDPLSLATLFAGLDDAGSWVRYRAMLSLIERCERASDETLRARLIAEGMRVLAEERQKPQVSDQQQMCAGFAVDLVHLGAPILAETVADLSSMLNGDHPWLPYEAFILLCDLGEHAPVDLLIDWFRRFARETHSDDAVSAKIEVLSRLGDRTPYALFADLLTDALPLASTEEGRTPYALMTALQVLEAQGKAAPIEPFLAAARHPDDSLRANAIVALGELYPQETAEVILTAFDGDPSDAAAAAMAARYLGERAPVSRLLAMLGDTNPETRRVAAETLKLIAPDELAAAQREAIGVLMGEGVGDIFGSLINTQLATRLGGYKRGHPLLLDKLAELLDWPYGQTQVAAAKSLGQLRRNIPDRAIRRLLELRCDAPSAAVRIAAEDALAEILTIESGLEDDTTAPRRQE